MTRLKWLVLGLFCATAAAGMLWIRLNAPGPAAIGRLLSSALEAKLGAAPVIFLRKYVVVEEKKPIAELALVSRQTDVEHRMESVRLGSKAELSLRAVFNVKAGFDLRAGGFAAALDPGLKKARLKLPGPKVLSLEMTRYEVIADRSGWWNRISESEKELAMRDLQADAKLEAIRAGILKDCKAELEKRMAEVSLNTGVALEYRYLMSGAPDSAEASGEAGLVAPELTGGKATESGASRTPNR